MLLGEFISEKVYNGKLRSCHEIVDYSCITFIDVHKGEELRQGNSYQVSVPERYTIPQYKFVCLTYEKKVTEGGAKNIPAIHYFDCT